jgi:hypothetical protein
MFDSFNTFYRFNYSTETNPSAVKEHYYSTISNDYDSVRNEPEPQPTSSNYYPSM